jgi:C1A family cysteine protease
MFKTFFFAILWAVVSARWKGGDLKMWADYKTTFNMQLKDAEEAARYQCFQKNLDLVHSFNADESDGATYSLNQFAHMCHDEFHKSYKGLIIPNNRTRKFQPLSVLGDVDVKAASNSQVDWRKKGAVTHVKNQGQCGSCWAFSAVGNMEGLNAIKTGKLVELSEEELVQCSGDEGNLGCQGGIMDKAFEWVAENGGIDTEEDYPYTSGQGLKGQCKTAKKSHVSATFSGHVDISDDEDEMAAWVMKHGPVSVAVDAGPKWQLYNGGIKTSCFAGRLDHGVLVVGYGTEDDVPYWIIKNSWGPMWGEAGYIRLKRGRNCNGVAENACSAKL